MLLMAYWLDVTGATMAEVLGLSFTLKVPEESVIHTLLLKVNSPNEQ